jgi:hypothetical protein
MHILLILSVELLDIGMKNFNLGPYDGGIGVNKDIYKLPSYIHFLRNSFIKKM